MLWCVLWFWILYNRIIYHNCIYIHNIIIYLIGLCMYLCYIPSSVYQLCAHMIYVRVLSKLLMLCRILLLWVHPFEKPEMWCQNHQNQNRHFVCMPLKPKHWSSCCFSFGNRQVLVSADNPPSGPGEGGKAPRPETTCSSGDTGQATLWGARKRLRELNGCRFRMSVGRGSILLWIVYENYHWFISYYIYILLIYFIYEYIQLLSIII